MPYKTDLNRARDILTTLCPRKIVIHIPKHCECVELLDAFKHGGYNVLRVDGSASAGKKLTRLWQTEDPLVVYGTFVPDELSEMCSGHFSMVYVFPNSEKSYAEQIVQHAEPAVKSNLREVVSSCMSTHKNHYQKYCDIFEDKVFTVLI
jgi:hypothetical protein